MLKPAPFRLGFVAASEDSGMPAKGKHGNNVLRPALREYLHRTTTSFRRILEDKWCGREDSNFHGSYPTATSTLRVYQFRHDRTWIGGASLAPRLSAAKRGKRFFSAAQLKR